jgi:hypothetical protein
MHSRHCASRVWPSFRPTSWQTHGLDGGLDLCLEAATTLAASGALLTDELMLVRLVTRDSLDGRDPAPAGGATLG